MPIRTDPEIRAAIIEAGINTSKGAPAVHSEIKRIAGDRRVPSQKTVGNLLHFARHKMPPDQQRPYRTVGWPDSFGDGALFPWEAGRCYFELRRMLMGRPRVSLMQWYWRVTLAMPELDAPTRRIAAVRLAEAEGNAAVRESIELEMVRGELAPVPAIDIERAVDAVDALELAHGEHTKQQRDALTDAVQRMLEGRPALAPENRNAPVQRETIAGAAAKTRPLEQSGPTASKADAATRRTPKGDPAATSKRRNVRSATRSGRTAGGMQSEETRNATTK